MNPHTEAQRLIELSARRDRLSEESKGLVRIKAGVWPILRKSAKSKADAEMEWLCSEDGIREKEIRIDLDNIDSAMSALKVWLRQQEMEARNQM
jgi:hypothetical protein